MLTETKGMDFMHTPYSFPLFFKVCWKMDLRNSVMNTKCDLASPFYFTSNLTFDDPVCCLFVWVLSLSKPDRKCCNIFIRLHQRNTRRFCEGVETFAEKSKLWWVGWGLGDRDGHWMQKPTQQMLQRKLFHNGGV